MSVTPAPVESPASRLAAAQTDLSDAFAADAKALSAPATDAPDGSPAADADAPTGADAKAAATAPDAVKRPAKEATTDATAAPPEEDAPITLTGKELRARIEAETKRATADQSKAAKELASVKAERDRLASERETLLHDNRVLFAAQQRVKAAAREQGAVGYMDVDEATNGAIAEQAEFARQQRENQGRQREIDRQAAQVAGRETTARSEFGTSVHRETVAAIREAALEHGTKLSSAEAAALITEGYADPLVKDLIEDWRDLTTAPDRSKQKVKAAFARIAELATAKVVQGAVAQLKAENPPLGAYDRSQAHGEPQGDPTPLRGMTPKQRLAAAYQGIDEQYDEDMRRFRAS